MRILLFLLAVSLEAHPLLDFKLTESEQDLLRRFQKPPVVAGVSGFRLLQFHALPPVVIEEGLPASLLLPANTAACDGKYAFSAFFSAKGELLSILHQPDKPLLATHLFPEAGYKIYETSNNSGMKIYFWVRTLPGDRYLIATVYAKNVKFLDQVLLIRKGDVPRAIPLLAPLL